MKTIGKQTRRTLFVLLLLSCGASTQTRFTTIRSEKKYNKIIDSGRPAVIRFFADWCGACKMTEQPFKELSQERSLTHIDFVQVNVDTMPDVSKREDIRGIPTFLYVAQGKTVGKTVGVQDPTRFKEQVRAEIRARLEDDADYDDDQELEYENETAWGKIKAFFGTLVAALWAGVTFVLDKIKYIFGRG